MRYRTVARSIRLGYNVLLLDSDVIVFDDPYKYLKHPPFKDIVVINQEEAGLAPNGGVLYVQNAAPDGPAAFMFAEIVVRQDLKWAKASEEMEKHIRFFEAFKGVEHAAPDNWHNLTVEPTASLMTVDLRMPNCRGWPEELGGRWYPAERGRFSKELLQQLQDDCPDCLMWPDAEDASNAAAADKVPTEKFALMPRWLGTSYWLRGREGYWDASLTGGVAQQVIGHTHYNPIGDTNVHRYVVPMSLGLYDWDLAQKAKGSALYTACASHSCSELKAAGAGVAEAGFNLVHHVVEINGADDPPGLKSLSNQPILFLDTLVHVDFESLTRVRRQSEAYQSLLGTCDLLNTTAMTHKYSFDSWNFATWQGLKIMDGPSVKANVADRPQDLKKGKLETFIVALYMLTADGAMRQ
ncbi:hypothetical protein WJX79_003884 [Trebouxia sp. C0005]